MGLAKEQNNCVGRTKKRVKKNTQIYSEMNHYCGGNQ